MRKWFFIFLTAFVLLLAGLYLFIPSHIRLSTAVTIKGSPEAAYRLLLNDASWMKWWPGKKDDTGAFVYDDAVYSIEAKAFNAFLIGIKKNEKQLNSQFMLIPLRADSFAIQWSTGLNTSGNPFKKMGDYFRAKSQREELSEILTALKAFLENGENIYGMAIRQVKVKDSILVTSRMVSDHYPTAAETDSLISLLRNYIKENNARETDHPMLHVDASRGEFSTMVGIPTDRLLQGNKDIVLKRMVLGNILEAEIKGGPHRIREALRQMEFYVDDYNRTSPAIPYESLVTDRLREPDTTRWITRLYYPVF